VKLLQAVFIYIILVMLAIFTAACVWEARVVGVLYRCTDNVPILDFIPPFVHSGGHTGDVYLVSKVQVYWTWYAYLGTSVLLPAVPLVLLFAVHWKYWRTTEDMA
jgi:hypothetical protein